MFDLKAFEGSWKSTKDDHFEEYLKEIGTPFLIRKLVVHINVSLSIKVEGNKVICLQESNFKNVTLEFEMNKEFEETTPDGKIYKSIVVEEDGKMIHRQNAIKDGDSSSIITRWIDNDILKMTMQSGNIICTKEYIRKK